MTPVFWLLKIGITSAVNTFFISRFLSRTLGAKHNVYLTYAAIFMFDCISGTLNVAFHLAGTILTNSLYYCVGYFVMFRLLFYGNPLKRLYFTVLVWCGYGIMFYIFLPLNYIFGIAVETSSPASTTIMNITGMVFQGMLLEYIGRKFQNLRHTLPTAHTIYLTLLTVFACVAVSIAGDFTFAISDTANILRGTFYCSLFSSFGMAVTVWGVFLVDRQITLRLSEQRYCLQSEHFKSKEQDYRQLTRLWHDIKNHFICLDGLLREGKAEQAFLYLESLATLTSGAESNIVTGNDFADALLNDKQAVSLSNGVKFTVDAALPNESRINPVDLCCILSNILDNAIHAAGQTDKKWIEMRAFSRQSQLIIEIKNSISNPVEIQNGRIFSKDPEHGVGLESVRFAIEKYGGVMEIISEDNCFIFNAMLPLE